MAAKPQKKQHIVAEVDGVESKPGDRVTASCGRSFVMTGPGDKQPMCMKCLNMLLDERQALAYALAEFADAAHRADSILRDASLGGLN